MCWLSLGFQLLSQLGLVRASGLSAGKCYTQAASFHISAIILAYKMTNFPDSLYSLAALLALPCLFSLAKAICFFRQKLSSDTPPLSPCLFLLPMPFFFFCPSSICRLYFAPTISRALSRLHSITCFSTCISLLFITPSIFSLSLYPY